MSSDLATLVSRLESVTSRLESLANKDSSPSDTTGSNESVRLFDEQIRGKFEEYVSLSKKIGGEVGEQGKLTEAAFEELRNVLIQASKLKKPSAGSDVFKCLTERVDAVIAYCEKRRASKVFNLLMTIKEGIGCVGWVSVSPKPAPYVKECHDQALFYGNRVIKGKDEDQVKWVRAYTATLKNLEAYIKAQHTTGLVWNKNGAVYSKPAPSVPSAGPPPPPPPPAVQPPETGGADKNAEKANLFASINKGGQVTQGLKKVTDDMKTHKNPELRASSLVKSGAVSASKSTPKYGSAAQAKKPPVLALQGKKWIVEYQENKSDLSITDTNPKQTVYVFKCVKSTLKVSGKVNSIILDNCSRVAVCFDNVISSLEVVNCQRIQVQTLGKCPTFSIDKSDGCQIYLSKDSLNCEIVSAKSSEMNVCIPPQDGSEDFTERPIPEQYKTVIRGTTLVTEATDITS